MSKLKMPPGCRDVTALHRDTIFTLIGAGPIKKRPTVPQGFKKRAGARARAIIGYAFSTEHRSGARREIRFAKSKAVLILCRILIGFSYRG